MSQSRPLAAARKPASGSLRELHKAMTRDLIRDAARQLFMANSVLAVTMEQIAIKAGVSRPTVYSHFRDKDEIISDIVEAYVLRVIDVNKAIAGPDPSVRDIRDWLDAKVAFYKEEGVSLSLLHQAGHGDPKGRTRLARDSMTQTLESFASRLPAFRLAIAEGAHQPHARMRAEMLVRQITAACDLCAREGPTPANMAALDITADLFRDLLDRFAAQSG